MNTTVKIDKRKTAENNLKAIQRFLSDASLELENEYCDFKFSRGSKTYELYAVISNASHALDKILGQKETS